MRTFNKVTGVFCLGRDPEIRYTTSGTAVATLSLASNHSYKKQGDTEWTQEVEWTRAVCFGKRAEMCGERLGKGSNIYMEGRLKTNKWQDKDGNDRYNTDVIISDIIDLAAGNQSGSGSGGGQTQAYNKSRQQQNQQQHPSQQQQQRQAPPPATDDDIPF